MKSGLKLRQLDEACGTPGSGQWSKYVRGLASPTMEKVARAESIVLGSSRCYYSPLWDFLDANSIGTLKPRALFEWLDEPFLSQFCLPVPENSVFWRMPKNTAAELALITKVFRSYQQPFDLLGALLALTHESAINQDLELFKYFAGAWRRFFDSLGRDPKRDAGIWSALPQSLIEEFSHQVSRMVEIANESFDQSTS